mmetsp:Transcript_23282/g.17701  ORF Transcript_23282/g.17701 Transcript_23282/m.17701 type:complete len:107 (-) Transcript_23282:1377-1697(-)
MHAYWLKRVVRSVKRTVSAPTSQLIRILLTTHTQVLYLGDVVLDLLALLFVHFKVEAPMIKTLVEVLVQCVLPHRLKRLLLVQRLSIVLLQPEIDDRDGSNWVNWQ